MRIVPLLLFPVLLPVVAVTAFIAIKLLSGQTFAQATVALEALWQVSKPYLIKSTNFLAVLVLLGILVTNRVRIKTFVRKQWMSLRDRNNE